MAQRSQSEKGDIEELRSVLLSVRAEVRRMETCIEAFRTKYEPLLKAMEVSSTYWGNLRRELLLHALKGSVWAMLGAVLVIVALGLQKWLRGFLA